MMSAFGVDHGDFSKAKASKSPIDLDVLGNVKGYMSHLKYGPRRGYPPNKEPLAQEKAMTGSAARKRGKVGFRGYQDQMTGRTHRMIINEGGGG